jgi:abortive infection bacteriophage resistance protein
VQYTKPPLSLEQQADLLINRGMQGDRALMIERLARVSYYRLSGYSCPFRVSESSDNFKPGTTFDEVWTRYVFDRRLRLVVMDAIERLEVAVRTRFAYEHSHAYGPFAYATERISIPKPNEEYYQKHLEAIRSETKKSSEAFVAHFKKRYGDSHEFLPIWMAVEVLNFGTIVRIYNNCANTIKQAIASEVGMPHHVVSTWLLCLNTVRNICAHHSRLWNKELGTKPKIPPRDGYTDWHDPVRITNNRVFAVLTICRYCLKIVAPQSRWPQDFKKLLAQYPTVPLADMGFPDQWKQSPIWADLYEGD